MFSPVLSAFLCLPVLFFPFLDKDKLSSAVKLRVNRIGSNDFSCQEKFLTTGREISSATVLDLNQQQNAGSICRLHGILWNSLHENVLKCGQFYNLLYKGNACFYRPESGRIKGPVLKLNECKLSCKIVKNCIQSEVCMIIKQSLKVLFTSDEMYKKYKRLVYTPPDLLLDKGMQPINYNVLIGCHRGLSCLIIGLYSRKLHFGAVKSC